MINLKHHIPHPPAVSPYSWENRQTPTTNSIVPPIGHLQIPRLSLSRMAHLSIPIFHSNQGHMLGGSVHVRKSGGHRLPSSWSWSVVRESGKRGWPWGAGDTSRNSDLRWGCMLRTGHRLLANALVNTHLGRGNIFSCFFHFFFSSHFFLASDWKRPPCPVHTAAYTTYVQILTWFFDTPVSKPEP